jgi:acyl-CoA synthetase (NDP forming)
VIKRLEEATGAALYDALFRPRSVGLVGLSSDQRRPTGRVLEYLRRAGYGGAVHVVNPRHDEVQGARSYASLRDLPEVPEHVYVLLGTHLAAEAVATCAEIGVKVVTVLADGFAEAGAEGARRQNVMVETARSAGMRLLGPNSMGLADHHSGAWITVNAVYAEPDQLAGRAVLISQSGSLMGGLISRARALGLGFSKSVGVGNEADLSVGEIGLLCVDDPDTDVFLLFLETIRDAGRLAEFAATAQAAGKPVVAYKLGRSGVGQHLAVAHTGALLSDDAVVDAYLRDVGIARVCTLDGLIEAATLFAGQRPLGKKVPVVGVITTTGGGGAAVCDRLALAGAQIEPASEATLEAIRATGLNVVRAPMTDLTLAGARPQFVLPALEAMARDPKFDVVVSVSGSSARSAVAETMRPLIEADKCGKPFGAFLTPEAADGLRMLIEARVPAFRTPESCADAIGALLRWRAPRAAIAPFPSAPEQGVVIDERASLTLLEGLGMPVVPSVEIEVTEAGGTALPFPYPVAAKVLSDAVPHKTEAGGVVIGVDGSEALAAAAVEIARSVAENHPGVTVARLLVQPMVQGLQEVLLGYRRDPLVGPVVTLAPGGVLVGLYNDKAVRLAPVDEATAAEMIEEVVGLAPLRGYRGMPKGDLAALARAVAAFSRLAEHRDVLEADANPVLVLRDGVVTIDALIVKEE